MKLIWFPKTRIQRNSTLRLAALVFAQWIGIYQVERVILQILSCTHTVVWNKERLQVVMTFYDNDLL